MMNKHLTHILSALAIFSVPAALAGELSGVARGVDGETLMVGEQTVRLGGIDAWELGQSCPDEAGAPFPCGMESLVFLKSLVEGEYVYCSVYKHPTQGEGVATCYRNGQDLGEEVVRNGWAVAYGVSSPRYTGHEKAARMGRLGGWRGLPGHTPLPPATWKAQR